MARYDQWPNGKSRCSRKDSWSADACPAALVSVSPVHLAAMPDSDYQNTEFTIVDLIHDPVVTDSYAKDSGKLH